MRLWCKLSCEYRIGDIYRMAIVAEHIKDCREIFNSEKKGYKNIHEFLDQYVRTFPVGFFDIYHRTFLHNSYGLAVIRSMWGGEAYVAGLIHLHRDYLGHPIVPLTLDNVIKNSGRVLIHFNSDLNQLELHLDPSVIAAWKGKSLVYIAFGN